MRARVLFVCSIIVLTIIAMLASPSLAESQNIKSVSGQVTDATGAPLPNATVSLVDASYLEIARTISDSDGNFLFSNADDRGTGYVKVIVSYVQDGKMYNLTKTPATWYASTPAGVKISAEETSLASYPPLPESTRPVQIFTVEGRAVDVNGKPLPGAEVHLYDGIYKEIGVTTTDENGNFRFDNASAASPGCKVQVFYRADGKVYHTNLQNVLWYPTDTGLVKINAPDTTLYDYPESETGYVWGIITDSTGKTVSGEVYLSGEDRHLTIETYRSGKGTAFVSQVPVGEYTVYAVHKGDNGTMKSLPASIKVNPSRNYLDYSPLILVADQPVPPEDLKPTALIIALVLGGLLICGKWYGLRRL
ncbi:carboxypeptidase regulatory-like domain-containing protein [Methanocella arvoryzae]|uniref:Carboxypeptidase regulatory-like domain-containing protein n=1 Tax=Methanocella arvoryzae (strain DSM 22066 / NBRC 105507 / MRE50) TaxID=351160 RepID=Q0W8P9_METAR|nr:carboxypeptidase regulatory-like domain-containing protein [Methanocella arvoryzae]CAJ35244.1 hypothetical protein LRC261 [Methanocella arvoryzae MRE50]